MLVGCDTRIHSCSACRLASSAALPKLKLIDFGNAQSSSKKAPVAPELFFSGLVTVIQKEFACFGYWSVLTFETRCRKIIRRTWVGPRATATVGTKQDNCLEVMSSLQSLISSMFRNLNYSHSWISSGRVYGKRRFGYYLLIFVDVKKLHHPRMTCGLWASSSTSWSLVNHFFRWIPTSWNRWKSRESASQGADYLPKIRKSCSTFYWYGGFLKWGVHSKSIFNRMFYWKPFILRGIPILGNPHVSWHSSIEISGYLESLKKSEVALFFGDFRHSLWWFGFRFLSTLDRCSVMLSMSSFAFPSRSDLATATWPSDLSSIKHVAELSIHLLAPLYTLYTALQTVQV